MNVVLLITAFISAFAEAGKHKRTDIYFAAFFPMTPQALPTQQTFGN